MLKKWLYTMVVIAVVNTAMAQKANFIDNDWNAARQKAQTQDVLLFVDAYTDWCSWCKVMDREVFTDTAVARFMNRNFVCLKMEMEHNYGVNLSMKYNVSAFPTYLVFDAKGNLVSTLVGYMPAPEFLDSLKALADGTALRHYAGISSEVDLKFPEFYATTFDAKNRKWADSVVVSTYLDMQDDLFTEVNARVLLRYYTRVSTRLQQYLIDNRVKYAELYGPATVENAISALYQKKIDIALKTTDVRYLTKALNEAQAYLPGLNPRAREYYYASFYMKNKDWGNFIASVDKFINIDTTNKDATINQLSWNVYEKVDDAAVIEKAVEWMKAVVERKQEYASMDTYAALLYKAKKYKEAERIANDAITLGTKAGEDVKPTRELLEQIKKAKN